MSHVEINTVTKRKCHLLEKWRLKFMKGKFQFENAGFSFIDRIILKMRQ